MEGYEAVTFIELVRQHECLYNVNSKPSTLQNRPLKAKAWLEISQAMQMSPHKCEKKWKNLRDSYTRIRKELLREEAHTTVLKGKKKKKWYLMDSLSFLAGYDLDDVRENVSNVCSVQTLKTECSQEAAGFDADYVLGVEHFKRTVREQPDFECSDWEDDVLPGEVRHSEGRKRERGNSSCSSLASNLTTPPPAALARAAAAVGDGRAGHKRQRRKSSASEDPAALRESYKKYDENEHFCMSLVGPMNRLSHKRLAKFKLAVYKFLAADEERM